MKALQDALSVWFQPTNLDASTAFFGIRRLLSSAAYRKKIYITSSWHVGVERFQEALILSLVNHPGTAKCACSLSNDYYPIDFPKKKKIRKTSKR